ncbi:DUF485 domain-containing protein [Bacillus sp. SA1-12]|uniref:DUF485 domain-containing protein n=1 Tax=Bacillus sp. SA1-12 TaxID=1455638 RepID=UPI000AA3817B|nr:DUF485 domain-containing protein [Bacillus sp. SA1-12]
MSMNENSLKQKMEQSQTSIDYSKIAQSAKFKELLHKKRNFILPMSLFYLAFYFTLPIMTAYSTVLNQPAIGSVSWAWVFAFAQFIMTWALCILYSKRAAKFDEMVDEIIEDAK